jgi:hypothetical protein
VNWRLALVQFFWRYLRVYMTRKLDMFLNIPSILLQCKGDIVSASRPESDQPTVDSSGNRIYPYPSTGFMNYSHDIINYRECEDGGLSHRLQRSE